MASVAGVRVPRWIVVLPAAVSTELGPSLRVARNAPPSSTRTRAAAMASQAAFGRERSAPPSSTAKPAFVKGTWGGSMTSMLRMLEMTRVLSRAGAGTRGAMASRARGLTAERRALRADLAAVDVAGHPLAQDRRELAVPVAQERVELLAVLPADAGDEQGAEGPLHLVAHAAEHHVGVVERGAHGVGQVLALEPLAEVEVEEGLVPAVQAGGGRPDELAELLGPDPTVEVGVGGHHLVDRVGEVDLVPGLEAAQRRVPADRVQPRPQPIRVPELVQVPGRGQEGVVEGVGRLVAVVEDPVAVVVELVGVAVVDGRPGRVVAASSGCHQCRVVHEVHTEPPPSER